LTMHLKPGGVFGLWSNDLPDDAFTARLSAIFDRASAETVSFFNPLQNKDFVQTIYLAQTAG
ncbi:MAG: spermidine synthase, partial [Hyphomicrobiales bacterium]